MVITIRGVEYGVGLFELLIILVILGIAIGIPVGVTLLLRKKMPGTLWIGILLNIVFCPFGQFYLKKQAWLFFIPLFILDLLILFKRYTYGWYVLVTISALIILLRFKKLSPENI